MFRDWRYHADNSKKKDFVLNNNNYSGKILVGGKNFGSGSSREHAAWAIYDYGFRCVISSFFADIFKKQLLEYWCFASSSIPNFLDKIFEIVFKNPQTNLVIDLKKQTVEIEGTSQIESFDINGYKKE